MPGLLPDIDPDGLLEFSVVYTDRALNHMSKPFFTGVMQDILAALKEVYNAHTAVLVPGSGTFGMEAVARQFANREKVLIVRNGWFSYRWSQIFDAGGLGGGAGVQSTPALGCGRAGPWAPCRRLKWRPPSAPNVRKVVFARMWRRPAASCSAMTTSAALPTPRTRWARSFRARLRGLGRDVGGHKKTGVDVLIPRRKRAGAVRLAAPW